MEFPGGNHCSHHFAFSPERRDEGRDNDQAGISHELGHLTHAADILDPVSFGKAQILVESVADIVSVEQESVPVHPVQLLFDKVGDGRFARARKPGEPQHSGLLVLEARMHGAINIDSLPMHVLRAAQREVEHARSDGAVGQLVDQDEATERAAFSISFEDDGLVGCNFGDADSIQLQRLGCQMLHRVDVDLIFGRVDCRRDHLRTELEPIGTTRDQRLVSHPHDICFKLVGDLRRIVRNRNDVAARAIDFVGETQSHRLSRHRNIKIAIKRHDFRNGRSLAAGQNADSISGLDHAGRNLATETAEIEIWPVDPLDRHAEGFCLRSLAIDLHAFEMVDQVWPLVPRRVGRGCRDIVALETRNRDWREALNANIASEAGIVLDDIFVPQHVIIDEVHLVHGKDNVPDTDQVREVGVAAGLGQDTFSGIDQDHRKVGR